MLLYKAGITVDVSNPTEIKRYKKAGYVEAGTIEKQVKVPVVKDKTEDVAEKTTKKGR